MTDEKKRDFFNPEFADEYKKSVELYERENDQWWDSLTLEEQEDAFYAVVKRIHKGEILERGSYRYVLYNVFGFDMGMYMRGMYCGYIDIHNRIVKSDDQQDS